MHQTAHIEKTINRKQSQAKQSKLKQTKPTPKLRQFFLSERENGREGRGKEKEKKEKGGEKETQNRTLYTA